MKRDQENAERISAIISVLTAEGILEESEGGKLKRANDYNEAREYGRGLKRRRQKNKKNKKNKNNGGGN